VSDFTDVGEFHKKFGLPHPGDRRAPHLIPEDVANFRLQFLYEELGELADAYENEDLEGIADALIDLVYVALGTAHFHHLPWTALFNEVQRANMQKARAQSSDDSKRNSEFDVVKPENWKTPQLLEILLQHGWPGPRLPFDGEDNT
jgi:predicted HAD superfamily Cof-like phosphohydrolase